MPGSYARATVWHYTVTHLRSAACSGYILGYFLQLIRASGNKRDAVSLVGEQTAKR